MNTARITIHIQRGIQAFRVHALACPASRWLRTLQRELSTAGSLAIIAAVCLVSENAVACSTCFGAPDSPMTKSMQAGIWVLLAVTGVVLACFGAFIIYLARRARQFRDAQTLDFGFIHNNERVH